MLKIAFIDHHLNNFHADSFLQLLREHHAGEVSVAGAWESDPEGEDWCLKNDVQRMASLDEAVQGADAIMVLAPDNVEAHPSLAGAVLRAGKPVFFDKMLAPSLAEANDMLQLAARYGSPVFSSSSLRYASEVEAALEEMKGAVAEDAFVRGVNEWDRYGIHTLSIALRLMGSDVSRLIDTGTAKSRTVTLEYADGRKAVVDVRRAENEWQHFGWSFAARVGDTCFGAPVTDHKALYRNLMRETVQFMMTGRSGMPIEEAVTAVAVIEGANRSQDEGGRWMQVP